MKKKIYTTQWKKLLTFFFIHYTYGLFYSQFNSLWAHGKPQSSYKESVMNINKISPSEKYEKEKNINEIKNDNIISKSIIKNKSSLHSIKSMHLPVKKIRITSQFGMRNHPIKKKKRFHNGIDIATNKDKIFSMEEGLVTKTGYDVRSGNFITILGISGMLISYCHLSQILVQKDQYLSGKSTIGISGSTGLATGDHLHITMKNNEGKYINPYSILKFIKK